MSNITKLIMLLVIGFVLAGCSIYLIGGKKQPYEAEVIIKAPVGQIFPYVANPELKQLWMKGLVEQELTSGEPIGEQSLLTSIRNTGGVTEQFDDEVIRFSENEIVSVKSTNKRLTLTTMIRLKEEGNGTRVTYKQVIKFNGIDRFKTVFAESNYQQELELDLAELAKLINAKLANPGVGSSGSNTDQGESSAPSEAVEEQQQPSDSGSAAGG